jgi:hypothetical protein
VKTIAAVAFVVLLAGVAACGSSDVDADDFRSALNDRTDLKAREVDCVVDATFDQFDQETINELYTASDREDLSDAAEKRFERIVEGCVTDD